MQNLATTTTPLSWIQDAFPYGLDAVQRTILFWDVMRQRGNNYLTHLRRGQPPVLVFEYEGILSGAALERPVNYSLVRILDRRSLQHPDRRSQKAAAAAGDRRDQAHDRRHKPLVAEKAPRATSRPIVIIDPRAGHGPGIGGSKQDSQIGMALDAGHPVYFMIFKTWPVPGQTLEDVRNAQIRFVEEVRRRHPDAPKPAVVGNCQGGWAAALVGAERPDLIGPMVFNGSPLSYWGGVEGVNPMRYLGGLLGGIWVNSFLSDLGNDTFDGANLVASFENLNPANTLWSKQYSLYAKIDTETQRYLTFEKWWGGFFLMTGQEIHTIVDGLFVGNKLERGEFELAQGKRIDLKDNNNPVVVFASFGDNITPPQQAFNWIVKAYGSAEEIRRRKQVIVVHTHKDIGHLGIFVSAKIARRDHKEIIGSFTMLDYLPPGLYEMLIEDDPERTDEYQVRFVEKTTQDLLAIDDRPEEELAFYGVKQVSELNDALYRLLLAPWVRMASSESSAEILRQLNPLRVQRWLFCDLNPWLIPANMWASIIRNGNRQPVAADNLFARIEKNVSESIERGLNFYRDMRDGLSEQLFRTIYENPWVKTLYPAPAADSGDSARHVEALRRQDAEGLRQAMGKGGFREAAVRIILALMLSNFELQRKGYAMAGRLAQKNRRTRGISPGELQELVRTQARILQTDTDQAIAALPRLLPTSKDRCEALALLHEGIKMLAREPNAPEQVAVAKMTAVLST
jgi:pimeloyl-ACP methyl ester carboxylesterase